MNLLKRISNIIKKSYKYFCIYNEKVKNRYTNGYYCTDTSSVQKNAEVIK